MPEVQSLILEKGLNLIAATDALPEGATPDCGNVDISAGGQVTTRGGSVADTYNFPTAAGASLEMYVMEEEGFPHNSTPTVPNASVAQLVFTGGRIYRTENTPSGASGISDIGSYTVPVGATVARRPFGVHFSDSQTTPPAVSLHSVVVFGDSAPLELVVGAAGPPTAITHADWTALNGYPRTCASYGGRMWFAASDEFPGRIWVTDVGKVGTFTVSSPAVASESFVLDLNLTTGGEIIGMKHLFDLLLVFTTRGIYRIVAQSGDIPYKAVFVSNLVAVSQHAIAQVENAVHFLTRNGVYSAITALTYGDIQAEEMSPAIAPLFNDTEYWRLSGAYATYNDKDGKIRFFVEHEYTFGHASALPALMSDAQAVVLQDAGHPAYPPSVTECVTYDVRGKNWTRQYFPMYIDYAVARDDGTGTTVIEAYHRTSTTVLTEHVLFQDGVLLDGVDAFSSYFRGKRDSFKSLSRRKIRFFPYVRISAGVPTINASVDGGAFAATQGATVTTGVNRRTVVGTGQDIQLEVYLASGAFTLESYTVDVKGGGKR